MVFLGSLVTSLLAVADTGIFLGGTSPPRDLSGWWPGEGNANDLVSGTKGEETKEVTYVRGKVGRAFYFTGQGSNYVLVPDGPALRWGTGSFTIEFWTKPESFAGVSISSQGIRIMEKKAYPVTWWNIDILPTGQVEMEMADHASASGSTVSDGKIKLGTWVYLAVVVDRAKHRTLYYINGVLDSAKDFSDQFKGNLDIQGRPLDIGSGGWNNYCGCVDELSLYSRALTASEILNIYRAGSEGKRKPAILKK